MGIVFDVLAVMVWLMAVALLLFSPIILAMSRQKKATGRIVLFCLLGFVPLVGVIFWFMSLVRAFQRDDDDGRRRISGWFLLIYFFVFLMLGTVGVRQEVGGHAALARNCGSSGGTPPRVRCSRLWSVSVATGVRREGSTAICCFLRTAC